MPDFPFALLSLSLSPLLSDMVTGMAFCGDLLISGAVSGKIRIYSMQALAKTVEIDAHARPIHALDVWPERGIFACGSEDSHVSLWTLPSQVDGQVRQLYIGEIPNALICGVQFNRACLQPTLSAVAYDSPQVHVLTFMH